MPCGRDHGMHGSPPPHPPPSSAARSQSATRGRVREGGYLAHERVALRYRLDVEQRLVGHRLGPQAMVRQAPDAARQVDVDASAIQSIGSRKEPEALKALEDLLKEAPKPRG